jgi:hypothetical protein
MTKEAYAGEYLGSRLSRGVTATSVFRDTFMLKGHQYTRCATPEAQLTLEHSISLEDPTLLGKFSMQRFVDEQTGVVYARAYHFATHQMVWYSITSLNPQER